MAHAGAKSGQRVAGALKVEAPLELLISDLGGDAHLHRLAATMMRGAQK